MKTALTYKESTRAAGANVAANLAKALTPPPLIGQNAFCRRARRLLS
ncbi:MAG: hypothetical protein LBC72_01220 [Spirochaetaceae bacterium]|nr:hypothetical protein [Spirochaetaceae bacterium]